MLGKKGVRRDPYQWFPALTQLDGRVFDALGFFHQDLGLSIEHLPGFREFGLAALQRKGAHAQLGLDLLYRVADRGLALVHGLGGVGVAAFIHHGDQRLPLIQTDFR